MNYFVVWVPTVKASSSLVCSCISVAVAVWARDVAITNKSNPRVAFSCMVIAVATVVSYFTATIPGGFHVPSPGGRIEGGSGFGQ